MSEHDKKLNDRLITVVVVVAEALIIIKKLIICYTSWLFPPSVTRNLHLLTM